jgi:hypothetical protein
MWPRLDALARMIELESPAYGRWLARPGQIEALLRRFFEVERRRISFGKLRLVGRPLPPAQTVRE